VNQEESEQNQVDGIVLSEPDCNDSSLQFRPNDTN